MDFLRTIWPTPFKIKDKNFGSFIIQLIIFIVVCILFGWLMNFLAGIVPGIGFIFGIIGGLMGIYCTIGVILCILKFLGVIK